MKTCKHCGAHNVDDACYCFNCGKKMDMIIVEPPQANYSFLLTVDDTFDIEGRGPVVTGIIEKGNILNGDTLTIIGDGKILKATCAGIEHNRALVGCAKSGDNVGILLNGVRFEDVRRGQIVTK